MAEVVCIDVHWDGAMLTVRPVFAYGWTTLTGEPVSSGPVQRFMVEKVGDLSAFGLEAALFHCVKLIGERWETVQRAKADAAQQALWDRYEGSSTD